MPTVHYRVAIVLTLATAIVFFHYSAMIANSLSESFSVAESNNHHEIFQFTKEREKVAFCDEILSGNRSALHSTPSRTSTIAITQIKECQRDNLVFQTYPMTELEHDYPLAYAISIYKNLNQFMRMFRLIVL